MSAQPRGDQPPPPRPEDRRPRPKASAASPRWECRVDDDVIDAPNEEAARAEFIQALVEDQSLIYVRAWREEGYEHDSD